jgi:antitoxin component YwqK of YwqJK toxin-antitoxin module
MQLEPIPSWRRNELKWVLEVTEKAGGQMRRLIQDGKEARRWETSRITGGRNEEREISGGTMVARRVYASNGDLLEEDQYSKGKLAQKSLYAYASSRVAVVRVLAADDSLEYAQEYFYTSRGSLREVRQTGGKKTTRISSFVAGHSGPSQEWNQDGDDTFLSRYDDRGRTVETEHRSGKELVSREDLVYREETDKLLSAVEKRPGEEKVITRGYDSSGRLQAETVSTDGKVVEEIGYARDDKGRVIRKLSRSAAGLEEWRYTLDDAGKTTREDFLLRGSLQRVTLYGANDSRTEELYQAGALFLKVYYNGDRRAREEVYADGKLVRERSFD